ncbi:MAG: hypothetical protein JO264_07630 [Acidisphaera sp.]|nr:hypothetical protein [Acidisphaera sp.]
MADNSFRRIALANGLLPEVPRPVIPSAEEESLRENSPQDAGSQPQPARATLH